MVTLYSTHCPMCTMLESELEKAGIKYNVVTDEEVMRAKGITRVPVLEVTMGTAEAFKWVKEKQ